MYKKLCYTVYKLCILLISKIRKETCDLSKKGSNFKTLQARLYEKKNTHANKKSVHKVNFFELHTRNCTHEYTILPEFHIIRPE